MLGIPYTEELVLQPRTSNPLDPAAQAQPPSALPPNKRQKLFHDTGTDVDKDASAPGHGRLHQQQEVEQVKLGKEGEQASVCKVIQIHNVSLLGHVDGGSEPGESSSMPSSCIEC